MKIRVALALSCAVAVGACASEASLEETELEALSASLKKGPKAESFTIFTPGGDEADVYYPKPKGKRHEHGAQRGRRARDDDGLPVVVLLQGAFVDKQYYSEYAKRVAQYGFVVVVPNHYASLLPGLPPQLFTNQMVVLDALAAMHAENRDPRSPLQGAVDTDRLALLGHSFGGAAALFTVEGSCNPPFCFGFFPDLPQLKAAAVYGTHLVRGPTVLPIDTSNAPVALLQGMLDNPVEATRTYEELETPRALVLFEDMNHFGITNVNNPPGAEPDPIEPGIDQKRSIKRLARWTGFFLRAHVLNDRRAERALYDHHGDRRGHVNVIADR